MLFLKGTYLKKTFGFFKFNNQVLLFAWYQIRV